MSQRRRSKRNAGSVVPRVIAALGLCVLGGFGAAAARTVPLPYVTPSVDAPPTARVAQRGQLTLQQAVAIAKRRYDGRVVRAETRTINGARVYVIRILDSAGRVRTVVIDAQTGQFR